MQTADDANGKESSKLSGMPVSRRGIDSPAITRRGWQLQEAPDPSVFHPTTSEIPKMQKRDRLWGLRPEVRSKIGRSTEPSFGSAFPLQSLPGVVLFSEIHRGVNMRVKRIAYDQRQCSCSFDELCVTDPLPDGFAVRSLRAWRSSPLRLQYDHRLGVLFGVMMFPVGTEIRAMNGKSLAQSRQWFVCECFLGGGAIDYKGFGSFDQLINVVESIPHFLLLVNLSLIYFFLFH